MNQTAATTSPDDENSSVEPLSEPEMDEAVEVQEEVSEAAPIMAEAPVNDQPLPQPSVGDTGEAEKTVGTDDAEVELAVVSPLPEMITALTACDIDFASTTIELVRFIQLQDFVPCDFDEDGIVDILAFNPRISTGYGFQGVGNGLFEEGPSFDLPFRPSACATIGDPLQNNVILLSREGSLSIFHPLVSSDPPTGLIDVPLSIRALGDEFATRFAVIDEKNSICEVYELIGSGVLKLGDYCVEQTQNDAAWYESILGWTTDSESVPGLPYSAARDMLIADFNCDGIPDLVSIENHVLSILLSAGDESLVNERKHPVAGNPLSIRVADVDSNGLPDILILYESGLLEIVTVMKTGE